MLKKAPENFVEGSQEKSAQMTVFTSKREVVSPNLGLKLNYEYDSHWSSSDLDLINIREIT